MQQKFSPGQHARCPPVAQTCPVCRSPLAAASRRSHTSLLQGRVTARNITCYANNLVTRRALYTHSKQVTQSNEIHFAGAARKDAAFPFCLRRGSGSSLVNQVSQPYRVLHKNFTQVYYLNHFLRTPSVTEISQPESPIMQGGSFGKGALGENSLKQRRFSDLLRGQNIRLGCSLEK